MEFETQKQKPALLALMVSVMIARSCVHVGQRPRGRELIYAVGPHVTRKTFLRRDLFFHVHRTTPKLANSPDRNGSLFSPGTFACLKLRRPDKIL